MDESGTDEIKVLPEKTQKRSTSDNDIPNPSRPVRFLISRQRASRGNSNVAFAQEAEMVDELTSHRPPTKYGYLEHIQSLKSGLVPDDKSISKKAK